jgi:hypothetical protein
VKGIGVTNFLLEVKSPPQVGYVIGTVMLKVEGKRAQASMR